jgi:hypothetical protein
MQKLSMRGCVGLVAVAAITALSAVPLGAHHGWGGYLETEFELSGTLEVAVNLAGPHGTTKIRTADGRVWDVVLAPSSRTERAGLKGGTIPLGSKVTAHGHRHRDQNKLEIKTERLSYNGRVFNVYPDRD